MSDPNPLARPDLDVNEVADGLVVYDATTDRVHYLNQTASAVFALCTGESDEAAIAEEMGDLFGLPEVPTESTLECLRSFRAEGLLA
ncbi:MAG TPA: PqqD family peptide modification chaperone [Acidimicrobiales bacterium]|nr:PqqD family peptide modification chaperone [Acidimicrobiales bacterium]